jgi:hypothetical protein
MADNPSPPSLPGRTSPLRKISPTAEGVGISLEFVNDIIERVEDLILVAQSQKPIPGNNVQINYTPFGAVINAITQNVVT